MEELKTSYCQSWHTCVKSHAFCCQILKLLPLKAYKPCVHRESRWHKEVGEVRCFCESSFKRSEILDSSVHALNCAELGTSHPALENQSHAQNTHIQDRARL